MNLGTVVFPKEISKSLINGSILSLRGDAQAIGLCNEYKSSHYDKSAVSHFLDSMFIDSKGKQSSDNGKAFSGNDHARSENLQSSAEQVTV